MQCRPIYFLIIITLFSFSCKKENPINVEKQPVTKKESNRISIEGFQSILDSARVKGTILIYNAIDNKYYSNDFKWAEKGFLPASTFKIPHSIIAIENNIVKNDSTILKWDGAKRDSKKWEQDLTLKKAFELSCVPCYQKIAKKIGVKKMKQFVDSLEYGKMVIDSTSIDSFWLKGNSTISPFEQIDFLKKLYFDKLPISKQTTNILKRIMFIENNDQYALSGKTGLSNSNGKRNGWFVGYIQTGHKVFFFATNVEPTKDNSSYEYFINQRKEVTIKALQNIKAIN